MGVRSDKYRLAAFRSLAVVICTGEASTIASLTTWLQPPVLQQPVYPPVLTQVLPQPNGTYPPSPREPSLMWNDGYPGYIPAYTASRPQY